MTTLFPGAIDSFSVKVDNVTDVLAAHVNDLQDSVVAIETAVIAQSPNANLLYHTLSHDIWPSGLTFNDVTDDTYVAGLWNAIHNGQNPDVSGTVALIDGSKRALKCLFDSASSQAGFVQFLSNEDTVPLRGKTLSFSIDAGVFNVLNMRCAIIEWVGTADTLTSDVVATWGAGNPTLATSWSYIGTPVDQATSGTTRIKAEGKVIGATTNNLAVFVWNPAVEASTDYFALANAKLEIGLTATAFVTPDFLEECFRVAQFYQKSYDLGTDPGAAVFAGESRMTSAIVIPASTVGTVQYATAFLVPMYKTPAVTLYASNSGTSGAIRNASIPNDRIGATIFSGSKTGFSAVSISTASPNAIAVGDVLAWQYVADGRL